MAELNFDRARAEAAVRELLEALGFDPSRPDLVDTPARVAEAYGTELLRGYADDPARLIEAGSEPYSATTSDPIVLDGIEVTTVCPHHLLIAEGTATVAYVPGTLLLGLGTIARLVDTVSRRLVLQEEIAGQVVDALMTHAGARGAFCRVRLRHGCLRSRGPEQHRAEAVSFASRGEFVDAKTIELVLGASMSDDGASRERA